MLGIRTSLFATRCCGMRSLNLARTQGHTLSIKRGFTSSFLKSHVLPSNSRLVFKRRFFETKIESSKWDTTDRYARLNRFQQYGRNDNNNSTNKITLIGISAMIGIYFGSDYLLKYVPGFTYFRSHPRDFVYTLLGLNVIVYGLWQLPKSWRFLQRYMLLQKDHIYSNWSIIGSAFSHQEFWHLGMNMLALWSFGTTIASMLGTANFFSLYMNSAIAGSLFSIWYPKIARIALMGPSLGASGALFGVLGCFSYLIPNAKILLFVFPIPGGAWIAFLASVAWNAAGCALRWGSFDYAAHLGGSFIGVCYGWLISKQIERKRKNSFDRHSKWI